MHTFSETAMSKNKLRKFAEMETLPNVFQCTARHIGTEADLDMMRGRWNSLYFNNTNPIVLELGCGHGEYTVGLAQLFPDTNFIGVDIKGARMWSGAKQAHQLGLANAAFLRTNIEMLPHFFAEDEVSEIWLTFPDPQMKKATKRLTSTYFLERYRQLLRDNGLIHLKTDSPFLFTYTSELLKANHITPVCITDDLYNSQFTIHNSQLANDNYQLLSLKTHYEQLWLSRGLTIKYLQFALPREGRLVEPEVEIEKDNYRSVGGPK